jgi:hypothetical protein
MRSRAQRRISSSFPLFFPGRQRYTEPEAPRKSRRRLQMNSFLMVFDPKLLFASESRLALDFSLVMSHLRNKLPVL